MYCSYQLSRYPNEGVKSRVKSKRWKCRVYLKGGNVEFTWKVEMSNLLVKGLVGIKAWTNEDNKLLLSNLKDLKGFISHFHHNFPIYPNYHYINVILNFPLFQNFDLIVTFSDLKVHQIILLLLFYFSSFLNMYCYYLSFVIIILYRIYVYIKIIVYSL